MARSGWIKALKQARERRAPLLADASTRCFRLLHGDAEGLPEVTLDTFNDVQVLSLYRDFSPEEEQALLDAVEEVGAPQSLYLKRRPKEARVVANTQKEQLAPERAARGPDVPELETLEGGLRYRIRPGQGLSVGLYLDMREGRAWLRKQAVGAQVLNLFAYTCAFGVVAKAGGAQRVLNVDASRRVLDWGQENAALNGQASDPYDYLAGDALEWLPRLARKEERFDYVILDPPSFATTRGSRFSAARDYARLAAAGARLVRPGGCLVACCNLASLTGPRFEVLVEEGLAGAKRQGQLAARMGPSPVDFPAPEGFFPALKVRTFELR